MLEGKDYGAMNIVSPFVAAFLDRAVRHEADPKLQLVHTLYSDMVNYLV